MRRASLLSGIAVFLLCLPLTDPTDLFQTVISPGDTALTQLPGINDSGTIAGYFGDGTIVPNNGFTLTLPGSFTPENFPSAMQTQVVGINNSGETVGFWIDSGGVTHGFTDVRNTFIPIDNPLSTSAPAVPQLLGVNNSGEGAGYYTGAAGSSQPFTRAGNTFTRAGNTFTPIKLRGLISAQATDVNNTGEVTGFNMISAITSDGFPDVGHTFTQLDLPGSIFTQALGLNNEDQVGDHTDAGGGTHGFINYAGTLTYRSIDDPYGIGTSTINGIGTGTINGINDEGQFLGSSVDANGNTDGFAPTSVPESGSLILLGSVLLALTYKLRRLRA